jgi:hypothetical protein
MSMAATPRNQGRDKGADEEPRGVTAARVGKQVLLALGTPPGWHEVQVRVLWDGHFRANVLMGESATCCTIGHSFFLVTDGTGNVVESSPEIVKRY